MSLLPHHRAHPPMRLTCWPLPLLLPLLLALLLPLPIPPLHHDRVAAAVWTSPARVAAAAVIAGTAASKTAAALAAAVTSRRREIIYYLSYLVRLVQLDNLILSPKSTRPRATYIYPLR